MEIYRKGRMPISPAQLNDAVNARRDEILADPRLLVEAVAMYRAAEAAIANPPSFPLVHWQVIWNTWPEGEPVPNAVQLVDEAGTVVDMNGNPI